MTTTEEIKSALSDEGLMSMFEKYASKLDMTVDECIVALAGDWEGEEDGLLRSIHEGDLKAMLVEEVVAKGMTKKPIVGCQMDIPHGSMVGSKELPIFMVRYWFGPGDTIYVETIDSDGKSYGFEEKKG